MSGVSGECGGSGADSVESVESVERMKKVESEEIVEIAEIAERLRSERQRQKSNTARFGGVAVLFLQTTKRRFGVVSVFGDFDVLDAKIAMWRR